MHTKVGTITATKMKDTVTVTVHRSVFHPLYRKRYRVSKKFLADSKGVTDLGVGDTVLITECRPLSKNKHFKITEVIKRAPRVSEMAEEAGLSEVMNKVKNVREVKEVGEVGKEKQHTSDTSHTSSTSRP